MSMCEQNEESTEETREKKIRLIHEMSKALKVPCDVHESRGCSRAIGEKGEDAGTQDTCDAHMRRHAQ